MLVVLLVVFGVLTHHIVLKVAVPIGPQPMLHAAHHPPWMTSEHTRPKDSQRFR